MSGVKPMPKCRVCGHVERKHDDSGCAALIPRGRAGVAHCSCRKYRPKETP